MQACKMEFLLTECAVPDNIDIQPVADYPEPPYVLYP